MKTLRNTVQLIGNVGEDPKSHRFENGMLVSRFSLATNETYLNAKGEKVEDTQWHNIVIWGKKADIAEKYLKKGSEVAVQGKLINRSYESNGEKKYVTEISLNELQMMDKKA